MKAGTCVHFTGIQSHRCKVYIPYSMFTGGIPCIFHNKSPRTGTGCGSYLEPTAEAIAEYEAESEADLARFFKAMVPVGEWIDAQGWSKKNRVSATGTVPCAACGTGTIHVSMAAYNGHVWGKCTTAGCVEWMQ